MRFPWQPENRKEEWDERADERPRFDCILQLLVLWSLVPGVHENVKIARQDKGKLHIVFFSKVDVFLILAKRAAIIKNIAFSA